MYLIKKENDIFNPCLVFNDGQKNEQCRLRTTAILVQIDLCLNLKVILRWAISSGNCQIGVCVRRLVAILAYNCLILVDIAVDFQSYLFQISTALIPSIIYEKNSERYQQMPQKSKALYIPKFLQQLSATYLIMFIKVPLHQQQHKPPLNYLKNERLVYMQYDQTSTYSKMKTRLKIDD